MNGSIGKNGTSNFSHEIERAWHVELRNAYYEAMGPQARATG